jgi:hypothetical protein
VVAHHDQETCSFYQARPLQYATFVYFLGPLSLTVLPNTVTIQYKMRGTPSTVLLCLAVLGSLGTAAPHQQNHAISVGKAIYFLTNDAQNAVVSLPIGHRGKLSKGTVTKTGGAGATAIQGATKQPSMPDALLSQSSLTVVENVSHGIDTVIPAYERIAANGRQSLFAVNPGSNTLTMFSISTRDPTRLRILGPPIAIPGEFPTTVAASAKHRLVCVGTTGAVAGISCASYSTSLGLGKMDSLRQFDIGQSTPPIGPTNSVSHTFFSNDESKLFTTVKGDPSVNKTGFLSVFAVEKDRKGVSTLRTQGVRSSPNGTAVLFGSSTIPNRENSLFVTDASFGAAVLSLSQSGHATLVRAQALAGQRATCWSTISKATNSAFVTDVAVNRVVEMTLDDARIISQLDLSANGDPGLIDLKSAGSFLYALSPGNGTTDAAITVLDVSGGQGSAKMTQHFGLHGIAGGSAQGMTVML